MYQITGDGTANGRAACMVADRACRRACRAQPHVHAVLCPSSMSAHARLPVTNLSSCAAACVVCHVRGERSANIREVAQPWDVNGYRRYKHPGRQVCFTCDVRSSHGLARWRRATHFTKSTQHLCIISRLMTHGTSPTLQTLHSVSPVVATSQSA